MNYSEKQLKNFKEEDLFQRSGFVESLAHLSVPKNKDPLVVGVYGEWGEGKTSIITGLKTELSTVPHSKFLEFNPWLFEDHQQLLKQLLRVIGTAYNVKLKNELEDYADHISFGVTTTATILGWIISGGLAAAWFYRSARWIGEKLGKSLTKSRTIEDIRSRVEQLMKATKTRSVIVIDDIDRLDQDELMLVLKLVKHTAGFSNITYILCCNDRAISPLISGALGQKEDKIGLEYLEKIVQVALRIPKARPDKLFKMLSNGVRDIINTNSSEVQYDLFGKEMSPLASLDKHLRESAKLLLFKPRTIKRFLYTLNEKHKLIGKNTNDLDLVRLTIIEMTEQSIYMLVRDSPHLFMDHRNVRFQLDSTQTAADRKAELSRVLEGALRETTSRRKGLVVDILASLFPHLSSELNSITSYTSLNKSKRDIGLHIASPRCFERYFSLSVAEDDLPESVIEEAINLIEAGASSNTGNSIATALERDTNLFFRYLVHNLERGTVGPEKLIAFAENQVQSISKNFSPYNYKSELGQSCILLRDALYFIEDPFERCEKLRSTLTKESRYKVAYSMLNFIKMPKSDSDPLLQESCVTRLYLELKDRMIKELKGEFCATSLQAHSRACLLVWHKENRIDATDYILSHIKVTLLNLAKFLQFFSGVTGADGEGVGGLADFTAKSLSSMKTHRFDIQDLVQVAREHMKSFNITDLVKLDTMFEGENTYLNIVRQFLHYADPPPPQKEMPSISFDDD